MTFNLHKYKVCEKHFYSGKPAYLHNTTDPDWLPTLHLGHKEHRSVITRSLDPSVDRWKRAQEREKWKRVEELLPALVTEEIQSIVGEEIRLVAVEQIETAMQYSLSILNQETIITVQLRLKLYRWNLLSVKITLQL